MRFLTIKNRAILRELVITDFKVRYRGSVLGYSWSLLRPLFIFVVLYVVFTKFLRFGGDVPYYPIYLLLGIVLWNFFSEATNSAMTSIVGRGDLIKKINIPKYLVVVSGIASALVNLGLNLVVVFIFSLIQHVPITSTWLLFPLVLLGLIGTVAALGFLLSALFVKYRDMVYVWEVLLQAGFYATPIIYPLSVVPEHLRGLIMLNPVSMIIQDARWSLISHETITSWRVLHWPHILIPVLLVVIVGAIAVPYFKKQAKFFAERI